MTESTTLLEADDSSTANELLEQSHLARRIGDYVLGAGPSLVPSHHEGLSAQTQAVARSAEQFLSTPAIELMDANLSGRFSPDALQAIDGYIARTETIEDKQERVREAGRLASMLGAEARTPEELEQGARRRAVFDDLVERGATPLAIRQLMGNAAGLEYFSTHATTEKQKNLLAQLASVEGLTLEYYVSSGISSAGSMLIDHPEMFELAVPKIAEQYGRALESGYPPAKVAKTIEDFFGPYTMNSVRQGSGEASVSEQYAAIIDSELRAIQYVGGETQPLQVLLKGDRAGYDLLMLGVANRLREGEQIDPDEVRAALRSATNSLRSLDENHPEVLEAFRLTSAANLDDPKRIEAEVTAVMKFAPDFAFLRDTMGVENKNVFSRFDSYTWRKPETGEFRDELFDAIQRLKAKVERHPTLSSSALLDAYLSYPHTPDSLQALDGFLERDDVAELSTDPNMARSIDRALFTIAMYGGSFDFSKDVEIVRAVNDDDPAILSEIIRADADTVRYGAIFHEVASSVLSRRDRDGNLYDIPRTLSRAIETYADTANDHQDIRWFTASNLPIAAMDTVMQFRKRALERGMRDDPNEIYEWIFADPEHIAEMSRDNLQTYVTKLAVYTTESGERIEVDEEVAKGLIKAAREMLPELDEDFRLFINMKLDTVQQIAQSDGIIRSTFEANGDKKDYSREYTGKRSGVEVALGIRLLDATDATQPHPVYGSAVFVGDGIPEGAIGYGEVAFAFKPDEQLMAATTFTPEDSFHGAHRLTREDAQIARLIKTAFGRGSMRTVDYVEAQVSTQLSFDAVEVVYVSTQEALQALPQELRQKAVLRTVAQPHAPSQYDGHRENMMVRQFLERTGRIAPEYIEEGERL